MTLREVRGFRLILNDPLEGRWNMAVDEALLQGAEEGEPVVRLYGFSPPTLSVGRFQRIRSRLEPQALEREAVTLVRRPTGGQAVLHDDELTYAVVLGRRHFEPFGKREVYRFIAGLLLRCLEALGVRGLASRARSGSMHNPDCFRSTGEYEIASLSHAKLIGSAQILTRTGCLQHGAIPLSGSYARISQLMDTGSAAEPAGPAGEQPASLARELGVRLSFAEARQGFADGFAAALAGLGVAVRPDGLSPEEQQRAQRLLEQRYGRAEWNLLY